MGFFSSFGKIVEERSSLLKPDQVGGQLMMNMSMMDLVSNHLSKAYSKMKMKNLDLVYPMENSI